MGHSFIQELPRTKKWVPVVAAIHGGGGAAAVAHATMLAAGNAILPMAADPGVVEAVWHLVRLPIAARDDDFAAALVRNGLGVGTDPGLLDVTAALAQALDDYRPPGRRSDLAEMAQSALVETVSAEVGKRLTNLFDATPGEVRRAFAAAGTPKRFGELASAFFARLGYRCLGFYLSRTLADHLGPGGRFPTLGAQAAFDADLRTFTREAAAGVAKFAGEWFSKAVYEQDGRVSRRLAAGFLAHAAEKLTQALSGKEVPGGP